MAISIIDSVPAMSSAQGAPIEALLAEPRSELECAHAALERCHAALQDDFAALKRHVEARNVALAQLHTDLEIEIEEHKSAQDALQTEQEFLRALLDNVDAGVVACDASGHATLCNRAMRDFHGLALDPAPDNVPDKAPSQLHADLYECDGITPLSFEQTPLARAFRGEPVRNCEFIIRLGNDAPERTISANAQAITSRSGQHLGAVAVAHDISARQRMEDALRRERNFINTVLDIAGALVCVVDAGGRIVRFNHACENLTGYAFAELQGKNFWESGLLRPEDVEQVRAAITAPDTGQYPTTHVSPWVARDGRQHLIEWTNTALYEAGQVQFVITTGIDVTARTELEARLRHEALHDRLTGVANRTLFMEHLGRSIARARRHAEYLFAVLFFDLDGFKKVNDSLGHLAGDALLVESARRLKSTLRENDLLARFGGDEFVVLLDNIRGEESAALVAERLRECLRVPLCLDGQTVSVGASVGIALSTSGYERPEDVLRAADAAMYAAKKRGKR